jgi:hypothetical protein
VYSELCTFWSYKLQAACILEVQIEHSCSWCLCTQHLIRLQNSNFWGHWCHHQLSLQCTQISLLFSKVWSRLGFTFQCTAPKETVYPAIIRNAIVTRTLIIQARVCMQIVNWLYLHGRSVYTWNLFFSKNVIRSEFLDAFAVLRKATVSFITSVCLSVCPRGTTRLPLDEFLWNVIFENFLKIRCENSNFIKIWHEKRVLCMKTYVRLW